MTPGELPQKYRETIPLEEQLQAIANASAECPFERWGDSMERGVLLYASHLLECEWHQRIATAGAATAIAQGKASSVPRFDDLNSTIYGQQFARLRDTLVTTLGFVV